MELTRTHTNKALFGTLRTSFDQFLSTFSSQPAVFESLARAGTPFGGNCLPIQPTSVKRARPGAQPAIDVQRQLDTLSRTVSALNHQIHQIQTALNESATQTTSGNGNPLPPVIGINRYRALRTGLSA